MMPSEIFFVKIFFVKQKPNKFMAAVFHFVHLVEKDS